MKNHYETLGEITIIYLDDKKGNKFKTKIDNLCLEKVSAINSMWFAYYDHKAKKHYVRCHFNSKIVLLHRLLLDFPNGLVCDHKNRDPLDNRLNNLRAVTRAQNNQNRNLQANNKSGVRGVYWAKQINKWVIYLQIDKKRKYFGSYSTIEEAGKAAAHYRKIYCPFSFDLPWVSA
jgi:hypothetical protein